MPVTPSDPTSAELIVLRALLDRSTETATPAVAEAGISSVEKDAPEMKAIGR